MLRHLFNKFGTTVYVQIWEHRLKLTDIRTGKIFDEKPLVAIEGKKEGQPVVVAVGNSAALAVGEDVKVVNPFSHPRVLFSDFTVGERLLQYALGTILGKKFIASAPTIVVHPMEKLEGGLTMIEIRAFRELAVSSGARDAVVYQGQELQSDEINFESIKEQVGE